MSLVDVLYPPRCLCCKEGMDSHSRFCRNCLTHFTLLSSEGRCEKCFSSIPNLKGICKPCRGKRHHLRTLGACFDCYGPAKALLEAFYHTKQPHFAKEIASFIVIQLEALKFPSFDLLTMIPQALSNPQYAIGREVSRLLSVPFRPTLQRRISKEVQFLPKRNCNLIDKKLLLLHTNLNTCQTVCKAAEVLASRWPNSIYGMSFCATYTF